MAWNKFGILTAGLIKKVSLIDRVKPRKPTSTTGEEYGKAPLDWGRSVVRLDQVTPSCDHVVEQKPQLGFGLCVASGRLFVIITQRDQDETWNAKQRMRWVRRESSHSDTYFDEGG